MRALPEDADVLARTRAAYAGDVGELVVTPDRIAFEHDGGFVHVDADAVTAVAHASDPAGRLDHYAGAAGLAAAALIVGYALANPVATLPALIAVLATIAAAATAFRDSPQRLRIDADGTTYPFDYVSVDAAHDVRAAINDQRDTTDDDATQ